MKTEQPTKVSGVRWSTVPRHVQLSQDSGFRAIFTDAVLRPEHKPLANRKVKQRGGADREHGRYHKLQAQHPAQPRHRRDVYRQRYQPVSQMKTEQPTKVPGVRRTAAPRHV
jgi:hypothetical protein